MELIVKVAACHFTYVGRWQRYQFQTGNKACQVQLSFVYILPGFEIGCH